MPAVSYTLLLDGVAASPELLAAVQQLEVEDNATMADMLRLHVGIGIKDGCSGWTHLDDDLFARLANIRVDVKVGSTVSETLLSAYIIETHANFANQPGQSTLDVVAMDPTVLMNLQETVRAWPNMSDADIAQVLFAEYGFTPDVDATQPARTEVSYITMQRGTDIQLLQQLAERNGFEFYVETDPRSGQIVGHFHRARLEKTPQGVLSVNMGEATNVNSFNARYDMLSPTTAASSTIDVQDHSDQQAAAQEAAAKTLGKSSLIPAERPRRVLLGGTGLSYAGELQTYAQAVVDQSALAISADGELNTIAYGGVLRAKRPVLVRGAGIQFSGTYYVEKVTHTFAGDSYTQRFTLRRNALGRHGQERFGDDGAVADA
jgi:phage protein D